METAYAVWTVECYTIMTDYADQTIEERRAARNAALVEPDLSALEAGDPTGPCGHEYGLRTCTRLTTNYREVYRRTSMDVKPQEVIDCLRDANVTDWCLMGLHGYVGYMPQPRATQDVDVMVPNSQKKKAMNAISARWPDLEIRELDVVIRFADPGEIDIHGKAVSVIDLMLPWNQLHQTILSKYVVEDGHTGSRIPTVEAAIVCKYAALISPSRVAEKKDFDAGDLRRLIRTSHPNHNLDTISNLANEVFDGGGKEIRDFIDCALNEKPFPV